MNEINLCRAIAQFIEPIADQFTLPTPSGEFVNPEIIQGYLPLKTTEDDFPFILVRCEKSTTTNSGTEVSVGITIGAFFPGGETTKEGQDGFIDCLNLAMEIRRCLLTVPNGTVANKYVLQDLDISMPAEQPWPQWQVDMTTTWYLRVPAIGTFPVAKTEDLWR